MVIDVEIFKITAKKQKEIPSQKERQHEESDLQMPQENRSKKTPANLNFFIIIYLFIYFFWNRLPEELAKYSLLKVKTPTCTNICLAPGKLERSFAEKDLGFLMNFKASNVSQVLKRLRYLRIHCASHCQQVKATLSLCSELVRLHLKFWVHFWVPQYKRDLDILQIAQKSVTMIIKELENLYYEEKP